MILEPLVLSSDQAALPWTSHQIASYSEVVCCEIWERPINSPKPVVHYLSSDHYEERALAVDPAVGVALFRSRFSFLRRTFLSV